MRSTEINNGMDIIDSRDIITRMDDLRFELEDAHEGEGNGGEFAEWLKAMADNDAGTLQDAARELITLESLKEEAEGYSEEWRYGVVLIRDSYFTKYAQELADDIGAIDANAKWPLSCIDWGQAAEELKSDYTLVDFDGVDYWVG